MSVKIRKKKEQRNTPLWNFIGVALIPLLLAFWGGFSMGNASSSYKEDYRTLYEAEQKKVQAMNTERETEQRIFATLDSLQKVLDDDFEELEDQLKDAFAANDISAIDNWDDNTRRRANRKWNKLLNGMDSENEENGNNKINETGIELLKEYLVVQNAKVGIKKQLKSAQADGLQIDDLEELEDELSDQLDELKDKLRDKEADLDKKDLDIKKLEIKLEKAQSAGGGGGGGAALSATNSEKNLDTASEIITKIQTLNQQIDTKMKAKLLGGRSQINSFKSELKAELSSISSLAGTIE